VTNGFQTEVVRTWLEVPTAVSRNTAAVYTAMGTLTHRPDDGGGKALWNVGKLIPVYTALQPRVQPSSKVVRLTRANPMRHDPADHVQTMTVCIKDRTNWLSAAVADTKRTRRTSVTCDVYRIPLFPEHRHPRRSQYDKVTAVVTAFCCYSTGCCQ
jgi:hypothetical protein